MKAPTEYTTYYYICNILKSKNRKSIINQRQSALGKVPEKNTYKYSNYKISRMGRI